MNYGEKLTLLIDAVFATESAKTEDGFRSHLGASVIGDPCLRKLWYSFRWADKEDFSGRTLRLFQRGQLEEDRFVKLLQGVGATVYTHDATTGKQFRLSHFGGHFGGSMDGVAVNLPDLPEPTLCEFKTSNGKNFSKLKSEGIRSAKPVHYKQAQVYLDAHSLKQCLYVVVNKDTEELYCELFDYDPAVGRQMIDKAESVIFGHGIPAKISDSGAWFECKFCPMNGICHQGKEPRQNCRTCKHSAPERDGTWSCALGKAEIVNAPKVGCESWELMNDLQS